MDVQGEVTDVRHRQDSSTGLVRRARAQASRAFFSIPILAVTRPSNGVTVCWTQGAISEAGSSSGPWTNKRLTGFSVSRIEPVCDQRRPQLEPLPGVHGEHPHRRPARGSEARR